MERRVSSFSIIIVLCVVLVVWWLSSVLPLRSGQSAGGQPLTIVHTMAGKENIYSGSLPVSVCDSVASSITASGTTPALIALSFVVTKNTSACQDSPSPAPFRVSVSSSNEGAAAIQSVVVNNQPVNFTVIDRN